METKPKWTPDEWFNVILMATVGVLALTVSLMFVTTALRASGYFDLRTAQAVLARAQEVVEAQEQRMKLLEALCVRGRK